MPAIETTEVVQVALFRRRVGMSRRNFQRHWIEVHGPLIASLQPNLGFLHYEQWHNVAPTDQSSG